ncbi:RagB/SusD family nutrient uptake outer membrane protein [Chitinophaga varians]|uniref:RagB/SusD family nutrient uptake outer membrane protein n=1 Tax=Chitinophaga varians TaxID=2202339 RepID=A0A847RZ74_9BACT|nr:RagB/SusD family nutrient uptake outer membrane protein [Chitinophaga varians]NLR66415.1 RagB/SusD family nutrient uptake outer membrane protein [Chitinophaga varians]
MKKNFLHSIYGIVLTAGMLTTACKKPFLDIVPDNVVTLKNAFSNKTEAEKYLYTCYGYLPDAGPVSNILFFGADDMWTYYENNYFYQSPWKIARGEQNIVNPWVDFWNGNNHARPYFKAIRDCNIFLENMMEGESYKHISYLSPDMQKRWIAEVKFLKAYYHFYLLRMYGPIPITDKSLPVSATPEQVKVKRDPVDKVVDYITRLLDEAIPELPADITNRGTELGRVTKPAAQMLKAKLLVLAASPLFNGNPDYSAFKDKDGQLLFNPDYDAAKWEKAAAACEAAIQTCAGTGIRLYEFTDPFVKISPATATQMSIRGSVTERWNTETVWALSGRVDNVLQTYSMVDRIDPTFPNPTYLNSYMAPTIKMAETFYSNHGVPINEDKTWDYGRRYELRTGTYADRLNIQEGYTTARLNFDRENRFYACLGFDGGRWFMQSNASDENAWNVKAKFGQPQGKVSDQFYSETGYWPKKLVNWKFTQTNNAYTTESYPWPEMRLADLYLLYAEALNETGKGTEAITWLDKIRKRAGLDGVVNSWTNYSTSPGKFSTKEGLRDIIHQERMIELCFEGSRNWDLRRWKKAVIYENKPVLGWDVNQRVASEYYRPRVLFQQTFVAPRDYLWPLREYDLTVNTNLVQNPGW